MVVEQRKITCLSHPFRSSLLIRFMTGIFSRASIGGMSTLRLVFQSFFSTKTIRLQVLIPFIGIILRIEFMFTFTEKQSVPVYLSPLRGISSRNPNIIRRYRDKDQRKCVLDVRQ